MIVQKYDNLVPSEMSNKELRSIVYQYEITTKDFKVSLCNGVKVDMMRSSEYRYKKEQEKRMHCKY